MRIDGLSNNGMSAPCFGRSVGVWAVRNTPLDAIPDLSDVQVIVYTDYPGQAPQVVEDQATYPLTTALLTVPKSKTVRGFSFFGSSFVYVVFEDGTDLYWARSRVLEYLSQAAQRLPAGVTPSLGPDATGVGWVYQYVVTGAQRTLAELRSIQDWFLRHQLSRADGVAGVVSGIALQREGQNALSVINSVRAAPGGDRWQPAPHGVSVQAVYDRSALILPAIDTLKHTLLKESLIVAVVCVVFLLHIHSALVAIVMLPIGVLIAMTLLHLLGLTSNIMSLGGIAIALGAMVDATVVMIENGHKRLEHAELNRVQFVNRSLATRT